MKPTNNEAKTKDVKPAKDNRGTGFYKNGKWESKDYKPKNRNNRNRGKEVEVNVKAKSINKADLSGYGLRDGSSGKNDISFWNKFPGLFSNATRIQAASQVGSRLPWNVTQMDNDALEMPLSSAVNNVSVPGVMVMRFIPTIGEAMNGRSPINQLLTSSYAWYRSHYRASARYEPADIGIYDVAISSASMLWAELTRLVGLLRMYKSRNLYTARAVIQALGYDCEDLVTNMANLEQFVNTFAAQLRQWPLPRELSLAARWVQLSSNVYKDSDSDTAQLYLWQTNGYYVYQEGTSASTAGMLVYNEWKIMRDRIMNGDECGTMTFENIVSKVNRILDPFFGSSSMAQLASDTSTAVGEQNMYDYPDINPNFIIEPKYEPEEQAQIENATFLGIVAPLDTDNFFNIKQVVGDPATNTATYLQQQIAFDIPTTKSAGFSETPLFLQMNRVLNVHGKTMTPDDIMINTRMMPVGTVSVEVDNSSPTTPSYYYSVTLTAYGTEVPTTMTLVSSSIVNSNLYTALLTFGSGSRINLSNLSLPGDNLRLTAVPYIMKNILASAFDWHPVFYTFASGFQYGLNEKTYYGGSAQTDFIGATVDYDEYSVN